MKSFNREIQNQMLCVCIIFCHQFYLWNISELLFVSSDFLSLLETVFKNKTLHRYFRVSQKFCNILITYLLYSLRDNKNILAFKVEVIVVNRLKPSFNWNWFQFLSFEVNNSFPEAFTSSWLLRHNKSRKWAMDSNK